MARILCAWCPQFGRSPADLGTKDVPNFPPDAVEHSICPQCEREMQKLVDQMKPPEKLWEFRVKGRTGWQVAATVMAPDRERALDEIRKLPCRHALAFATRDIELVEVVHV